MQQRACTQRDSSDSWQRSCRPACHACCQGDTMPTLANSSCTLQGRRKSSVGFGVAPGSFLDIICQAVDCTGRPYSDLVLAQQCLGGPISCCPCGIILSDQHDQLTRDAVVHRADHGRSRDHCEPCMLSAVCAPAPLQRPLTPCCACRPTPSQCAPQPHMIMHALLAGHAAATLRLAVGLPCLAADIV